VVTEPANAPSEQYTEQLSEAIGTLFSRLDYSITGNLTRALRQAHDHLKEWNRTSMPDERVGAGASLLALREDVGYLAQVGPSLALYGDGSRARRFRPPDGAIESGIGLAEDFRPTLSRFELGLGESVLLCGSALGRAVTDDHVTAILGMDPEEALGQVYVLVKENQNLGAILISHVAAGTPHAAPSPAFAQVPDDTEHQGLIVDESVREDLGEGGSDASPTRDPFAR
jgi:hypothetical protein